MFAVETRLHEVHVDEVVPKPRSLVLLSSLLVGGFLIRFWSRRDRAYAC